MKGNILLTVDDVKVLEWILWGEVGSQKDYESEYGSKPLGEVVSSL